MSNPIITCPVGCEVVVPPINMDECNPAVDISEIQRFYMTNIDYPLADWTSLAEWTTRIDNSGVVVSDIRDWWVSGELPEPERNITEIDNNREVSSPLSWEAMLEVFDVDTTTYDAIRQLQCGGRKLIWYAAGDYIYGGTSGIEADIIAHYEITKGIKEINKAVLKVKFDAKVAPERIANPLL